jgi:hypothetical protein
VSAVIAGLRANAEDLELLRLLEKDSTAPVPPFNASRLIAMQLVERHAEGFRITEKGRALLAKR